MEQRAVRGRRTARLMLFLAAGPVGFVGLLIVAQPNVIGPMVLKPPVSRPPVLELGALGVAVGLAWMIRIERSARDPERHKSWWRLQP